MTTEAERRALASGLSLAVVRLTRHLRGRRSAAALSLSQLSALATLKAYGSMTPGALAARERVQPPSMTRVIASLREFGYVTREPHATDGRQITVALSASGRALLADEASVREAWLTEQLADLSDEQLKVLAGAVEIIDGIVKRSE